MVPDKRQGDSWFGINPTFSSSSTSGPDAKTGQAIGDGQKAFPAPAGSVNDNLLFGFSRGGALPK